MVVRSAISKFAIFEIWHFRFFQISHWAIFHRVLISNSHGFHFQRGWRALRFIRSREASRGAYPGERKRAVAKMGGRAIDRF